MSYTEADIQDIENMESVDNAVLLKEIKSLREEVSKLRGNLPEKTDEQKRQEIMSIKDTSKRLQAIRDNYELFKRCFNK